MTIKNALSIISPKSAEVQLYVYYIFLLKINMLPIFFFEIRRKLFRSCGCT